MSKPSPLEIYDRAVERGLFQPDAAQRGAAIQLTDCRRALYQASFDERINGVYLWGPVGRGKTWLMDRFHASLELPAWRQHFHHFMRWVHRRLFHFSGSANPLDLLARELNEEWRVLCLDELQVEDIADAMLLGRLFEALFARGVVLVATSNQAPDQLYADGFNRERFLPAIEAIKRHTRVVNVDGGQDHRLHPGASHCRYWMIEEGRPSPLAAVFEELNAGRPAWDHPVELGNRRIPVIRRGETVLWCRFAALCEQPLSALDFITLGERYDHVLLSEVPRLGGKTQAGRIARGTEDAPEQVAAGDRRLPPLASQDDSVRRFIALVDECYDRGIPLYIEAEVALDELYSEGYLTFPFRRTLSRLREMQLKRFPQRDAE
ncbi:cell division protein ZapE [Pistricoccus aurantiacus]|uniref:cell division protein ZapE n=1 Tax=Pistricoccus aurantiacus TaxID=1883414 RepID=UPI0036293076